MSMESQNSRINDPDKARQIAYAGKPKRDEAARLRKELAEFSQGEKEINPKYKDSLRQDRVASSFEQIAETMVNLTDEQLNEKYISLEKESEELRRQHVLLKEKYEREREELSMQGRPLLKQMEVIGDLLDSRGY